MASSIMLSAMSLDTVIGTKRQTSSPDGLNKKRRKQSKPVRIASTEDSLSGDLEETSESSNVIVSGNFSINSDLKMTPLNLSKNREYYQKDDIQVNISNTDDLLLKQNISPISNNIENENNLALNLTPNGHMDPTSQVKIFNLEAFCDICNKEFCNKYFLRTHKANKHRVYEPAVDPAQSKTLVPTKDLSGQSYMLSQKSWSRKKKHITNNGVHIKSNNSKTYNNGINSTMRAFCNICRKEFCNKYFVRRHKAKIHGILDSKTLRCSSESSSAEEKCCLDFSSQPLDYAQDSNDSEVFEKEDLSKNQCYNPNDALNLTCSFCDEELNDSNALLKHLEEIHNNPDGEINLNNAILYKQLTQNNACKEANSKEGITLKSDLMNHEDGYSERVNLNSSIENSNKDDLNAIEMSNCLNSRETRDNRPYVSGNISPLNLVLGNIDTRESLASTWVPQNCILCGELLESLYMYQTHIIKCHNIHITTKNGMEQETKDLPSLPFPISEKPMEQHIDKEKYADDVKILHKMILKMNFSEKTTTCDICKFDFKNITYLEHHILIYHRALLDSVNTLIEESSSKDVSDNGREGADTPQDNNQISSFCDICKKELCNKYFMKTHMQRMHGISIETGTHIGGVMCDICNKELCSKYFLRVHKQNSHGLVDDSIMPRMWVTELLNNSSPNEKIIKCEEEASSPKNSNEVCPLCNKRFRQAKCLKVHLSVEHGEKILDSSQETPNPHFTVDIDDKAEFSPKLFASKSPPRELVTPEVAGFTSQNSSQSFQVLSNILSASPVNHQQYHCSQCSFSTTALAYLYVHKRSHLQEITYTCPVCSLVLESRDEFTAHFSLHEKIESMEIHSQLGETCWNATSNSDLFPNAFKGNEDKALAILPKVQETLMLAASKLLNPLSFAVPYVQRSFTMQPFFVESSDTNENDSNILSSFVFLPVKKKLSKPVTTTLRLTPTK